MGIINKVYSAGLFCRYTESAYMKARSRNLENVTPYHLSLLFSDTAGQDQESLKPLRYWGADKQTFLSTLTSQMSAKALGVCVRGRREWVRAGGGTMEK